MQLSFSTRIQFIPIYFSMTKEVVWIVLMERDPERVLSDESEKKAGRTISIIAT